MALDRTYDLNASHLFFQLKGGDESQFEVVRYRASEGICQLYRYEIEALCHVEEISLEGMVGVSGIFKVQSPVDSEAGRTIQGIVGSVEHVRNTPEAGVFRIELFPTLWQLTHRYFCRIFQEISTPQIIEDVLKSAGFAGDYLELKGLSGVYAPRTYCVQYRETDFNFICRLLEDEGIWWDIVQNDAGDALALHDGSLTAEATTPELPFVDWSGLEEPKPFVNRFRFGVGLRPDSVHLVDYDFTSPSLDLNVHHELGERAGFIQSDYPGGYQTQSDGSKVAERRAAELVSTSTLGVGQSNSLTVLPGKLFKMIEHPIETFNQTYLVTQITHQGMQAAGMSSSTGRGSNGSDLTAHRSHAPWVFHNGEVSRDVSVVAAVLGASRLSPLTVPNLLDDALSSAVAGGIDGSDFQSQFTCLPSEVEYRPARVTPKPVMRGAQTARVVGEGSEEIYTDEYGRVKVQFFWDLEGKSDENSSCWIRVCQGMSGGQYGMMFLPRIGQEVVVDFLEGDPDKPIIVGRVPNADNMPPYALPDEKTKSCIKTHSTKGGGGTNEICFEDLKDSEQFLIHAQKDYHTRVGEESRENIGTIQHIKVEGEQRLETGGHRSAKVGGKDALEVAETMNVVVKGDVLEDFKANHGHEVASQYLVKANQFVVEAKSGISLTVGGNFIMISPAGIFIKGTIVNINSGGAALTGTVTGSPAAPAAPEDADEVTPGKDPVYDGSPNPLPPIEEKPYEGHWISIDLKDDEGNPMAGECYIITTPGGSVVTGTLDVNGFARVWVEEEGECKTEFPRLDNDNWEQA